VRDGRGFELHPNSNTYIGQFKDGKAHGIGTYKWANGEEYDGQWVNGVRQGKGVWKGNLGINVYIGDWK
jgi:hypothetical protein